MWLSSLCVCQGLTARPHPLPRRVLTSLTFSGTGLCGNCAQPHFKPSLVDLQRTIQCKWWVNSCYRILVAWKEKNPFMFNIDAVLFSNSFVPCLWSHRWEGLNFVEVLIWMNSVISAPLQKRTQVVMVTGKETVQPHFLNPRIHNSCHSRESWKVSMLTKAIVD